MAKKRKKKFKISNRPLKIRLIASLWDDGGYLQRVDYLCDGEFKYINVSYLRIEENPTAGEKKHIIRWLEKYHPNRTHIIDDPEYEDWYKIRCLNMDPDVVYGFKEE